MDIPNKTPNGHKIKKVSHFDNEEAGGRHYIEGKGGLELSEYVFEAATSCRKIYTDMDKKEIRYWTGTIVKNEMKASLGKTLDTICSLIKSNFTIQNDLEIINIKIRDTPDRIRVKIKIKIIDY